MPVPNTEIQLMISEIYQHFCSRVLGDEYALEIRLLLKFLYWAINICHPLENFKMLYRAKHDVLLLKKKSSY